MAKPKKQKNFRLSDNACKLLGQVAPTLGDRATETDVIEYTLARYALEMRIDVERARAILLEAIAKSVSGGQK